MKDGFLTHKPLVVAKVLHWFEDKLPEQTFWRIHKSHRVNCSYIEKINAGWAGAFVLLSSGEAINVSRRKRSMLNRNNAQLPSKKAA
jgi:DNA-binding LytR/AlgR family response regulator